MRITHYLPDWIKDSVKYVYKTFAWDLGDFEDELSENIEQYHDEFYAGITHELRQNVKQKLTQTSITNTGRVETSTLFALYSIIRITTPSIIVETGVANGFSTLHFLQALKLNEMGHLYSVDFPFHGDDNLENHRDQTYPGYGGAAIPSRKKPGWIIPENLKSRWTLKLGKSQKILPEIFTEIDDIDLFFHDSEHSMSAMLFEFDLAWNHLKTGGFLVSDDVTKNNAFQQFQRDRSHASSGYITRIPPVGYIRK